jgi:hypothetical protein
MKPENDIGPLKPPSTRGDRKYLLFLVCLGIFALTFAMGTRSLENKDSVRFAEVSREILEYHDWILLRLGGQIYPDKPALHFWMIAGLYKLFGISPLVARIPEAAAGFCGLLLIFFFARGILGSSETAFLAAVVLLSSYGYFFWARRTRIDIELAVFYSMSLILFYYGTETQNRRHKTLWYAGFWLSTGLACMCKGPVAFTNLGVVIAYGIYIRRRRIGLTFAPGLLAILSPLVSLPILPWVVPLVRHPNFSGFMETYHKTVIMHRGFSFFTYFYDFPIRLFPASPFFFLGVWGYFRFRRQLKALRGLVFILLWVGVYVFILHLTTGKNARYLLPIHVPVSLVAAWAITYYLNKYPVKFGQIMLWGDRIFLAGAIASAFLPLAFAYHFEASIIRPIPYMLCLGLAIFLIRKFVPLKTAGTFLSFIMILVSIEVADGIVDNHTADYRQLSRMLQKKGLAAEEVVFYQCYRGGRANLAIGYYYNKVIACSNDFEKLSEDPQFRGVVATRESLEELKSWEKFALRYQVIPMQHGFRILLKNQGKGADVQGAEPSTE